MTTPRDSRAQALNALAHVIHAIRDDWDTPGIVAALRQLALPLPVIAIAAIRYATDPANLTPAHIADLTNRAWDSDWYPPCRRHPDQTRRHTSGECASCRSERIEAAGPPPERTPTPPPKPLRQLVGDTRRSAPVDAARSASERTLDA